MLYKDYCSLGTGKNDSYKCVLDISKEVEIYVKICSSKRFLSVVRLCVESRTKRTV